MTNSEFKHSVAAELAAVGFEKHGASFIKEGSDVACVIGLQKSRFSRAYYLNAGFLIRSLHPDMTSCDYSDGDVRARITPQLGGSDAELFELEKLDAQKLKALLGDFVETLVVPSLGISGLRNSLKARPVLLYQTTIQTKRALGLE